MAARVSGLDRFLQKPLQIEALVREFGHDGQVLADGVWELCESPYTRHEKASEATDCDPNRRMRDLDLEGEEKLGERDDRSVILDFAEVAMDSENLGKKVGKFWQLRAGKEQMISSERVEMRETEDSHDPLPISHGTSLRSRATRTNQRRSQHSCGAS